MCRRNSVRNQTKEIVKLMASFFNWNTYKLRKRLNIPQWLKNKNITSYEGFSKELIRLGVRVPSEKDVSDLFVQNSSNLEKKLEQNQIDEAKTLLKEAEEILEREEKENNPKKRGRKPKKEEN